MNLQCLYDPSAACEERGKLSQTSLHNISTVCALSGYTQKYAQLLSRYIEILRPRKTTDIHVNNAVAYHIETTGAPIFDIPRQIFKQPMGQSHSPDSQKKKKQHTKPYRYPFTHCEDLLKYFLAAWPVICWVPHQ